MFLFLSLLMDLLQNFFRLSQGLRQGFPLAPLLFLLITEGFGRVVLDAKHIGELRGISFLGNISITHILFVDDILLFYDGTLQELRKIAYLIHSFCQAMGMKVNHGKSSILIFGLDDQEVLTFNGLFPYHITQLEMGFKYLGFRLKPSSYTLKDWNWLIIKCETRILN